MAFNTGYLEDPSQVLAGTLFGGAHVILSEPTFEDGLKVGRFAKLDSGSLDNLDSSATPVIAGVVVRNVAGAVEDGQTIDAAYRSFADYARAGLIAVDVKSGETPAYGGAVYADNATGEATATDTDIATNGEFIKELASGLWLIRLK